MLIYAGIDEAGYGPLLGPLCVGCSVFVINDHDPAAGAPNLWKTLHKVVCRKPRDARGRIAVEDSKKLKGANSSTTTHPLKHLERGVLSFCSACSDCPATDADMFAHLGAAVSPASWCNMTTDLPVAHTMDQVRIASNRLRRGLESADMSCAMLACEAIHPDDFNRQIALTKNKASVNMATALRLVDRVWQKWPAAGPDHPRVILDRHGGRTRYRDELQIAWPEARIQIIAEDEGVSRYRMERGGAMLTITFLPEAEQKHLPVALASMVAKYTRELFMLRLNRYFAQHVPELKPTAGYYTDAKRYLAAIEPVLQQMNVDREELVRSL